MSREGTTVMNVKNERGETSNAVRWACVGVAAAATGTALALSVLSGWQRGGTTAERGIWIALGAVLVLSAHLLPALVHAASRSVRAVAFALWVGCLVSAGYGHAGFFLLAQQHAGDLRVRSTGGDAPASARTLPAVMLDRVTVVRQLGEAQAQRCVRTCPALDARRATLVAQRDALDAEADELRHSRGDLDRAAARRDALRADPVTSRLSSLLDAPIARVDLLTGLMLAAVLEGVACLLWTIALRPVARPAVTRDATRLASSVRHSRTVKTASFPNHAAAHKPFEARSVVHDSDEATRLALDIEAGNVRATVADIRRYLRCSQARAIRLRKEVAGFTA
jgi:hypothetical protein